MGPILVWAKATACRATHRDRITVHDNGICFAVPGDIGEECPSPASKVRAVGPIFVWTKTTACRATHDDRIVVDDNGICLAIPVNIGKGSEYIAEIGAVRPILDWTKATTC